jgi:N-acetylmuramoyl-L-alanine amidase
MPSRNVKIIVSVLMLTSLLVLIFSAAGYLGRSENIPAQTSSKSSQVTSTSMAKPTNSISGTSAAVLQALSPDLAEPGPTTADLRRWPAKSSIPVIHQVDLTVFAGRAANQKPLAGITVILDPGHGGKDSGTSYPYNAAAPEIVEKDINLAVSLKTRTLLESMGAKVVMTRDQDDWLLIYSRLATASRYVLNQFIAELPYRGYNSTAVDHLLPQLDEMIRINSETAESGGRGLMLGIGAGPDQRLLMDVEQQYPDILFISLHCNSLSNDSSVGGLQVYYQTVDANYEAETGYAGSGNSAKNHPVYTLFDDAGRLKLATILHDSILQRLPDLQFSGKSDLKTGDYAILREMNLVSVLVEMGFVTNADDRQILLDPNGRQKIAQGVADAVYAYYCK